MTMASDHQPTTTTTAPSAAAPRTGRHRLDRTGTFHVSILGHNLAPKRHRARGRLKEARLRFDLRAERAAREIAEARRPAPADAAARDTAVIAHADRFHHELGNGEHRAQLACARLTARLHELLAAGERHITIGEALRLIRPGPFTTDSGTGTRTFTDGSNR